MWDMETTARKILQKKGPESAIDFVCNKEDAASHVIACCAFKGCPTKFFNKTYKLKQEFRKEINL